MLTSVWSTIVAFGEAGRSKVLKSIMAFADTLGSPFTAHSHADTAANVALKKVFLFSMLVILISGDLSDFLIGHLLVLGRTCQPSLWRAL